MGQGVIARGTVLGERFEVLGTLGRGGMASVYLCEDRVRQTRVALKLLHPHLADDPAMRARLRREVHAATVLKSDAALVAHDLHELDGHLALSMPFHPGRTLAERVSGSGWLEEETLRSLGQRLAGALADAHRAGLLHRDVTPNNVMLDDEGSAVLTDFGLARLQGGPSTGVTGVLGTPGYAPPEVYRGVRTDPRSDLYGLGAVLYYAAAGRGPFKEATPAATLEAQLSGTHRPLQEVRPDLPEALTSLIDGLLARNPDWRPQTASEVLDALDDEDYKGPGTRSWQLPVPVTLATGAMAPIPTTREASSPAPAASPALPSKPPLPAGRFTLVVKRRWGSDATPLAAAVARLGGLDDQLPLEWSRGKKRLRLVHQVNRATAEHLAQAAEANGFKATIYDVAPPTAVEQLAEWFWVPIPIMWVAFPFLVEGLGLSPTLLIPLFVAATILVSVVGPSYSKKTLPEGLGLAYTRDLGGRLAADRTPASKASQAAPPVIPSANPVPAPQPVAAPSLVERALQSLSELRQVVASSSLPDAAANDLRDSVSSLERDARALDKAMGDLEAALAEEEEDPGDARWLTAQLERLETLASAGESVDERERARLQAVLDQVKAAAVARQELETRLTAHTASVLEIAAIATRTRRELLAAEDPAVTGRAVQRLRREAQAAVEAGAEIRGRAPGRDRV